jgi:NAD(P)-dependent dehydrogenase (short-subunit alcohol dehydrogenase family)
VVVNELGIGPDGRGTAVAKAEAVAQEIRDAGGVAVADTHSVADRESAEAVVQTAIDAFGRVDVLVNNAGFVRHAQFHEHSEELIRGLMDVHAMGTIWMTWAAWPHMMRNGYGRVVNIASGAMIGTPYVSVYGAGKGAAFGLARVLAVEGQQFGIKVNTVMPSAGGVSITVFDVEPEMLRDFQEQRAPELVSPLVALLSHEDCPCSGKLFNAFGGQVSEVFLGETQGYSNREITIEDLRANWDRVTDRSGARWLADAVEFRRPPFVPKPTEPVDTADT